MWCFVEIFCCKKLGTKYATSSNTISFSILEPIFILHLDNRDLKHLEFGNCYEGKIPVPGIPCISICGGIFKWHEYYFEWKICNKKNPSKTTAKNTLVSCNLCPVTCTCCTYIIHNAQNGKIKNMYCWNTMNTESYLQLSTFTRVQSSGIG